MFRLYSLLYIGIFFAPALLGQSWVQQTTPSPGDVKNLISDIAVVNENEIWAVGSAEYSTGLFFRDLVLRYDGTSWAQMPSPTSTGFNTIDGSSPSDIWAASANKLWHYDGSSWMEKTSDIPYPIYSPPAFNPFFINDIEVLAPDDIYVTGFKSTTFPVLYVLGNWMVHYDGSSWTEVSLPDPYNDRNTILRMDAFDSDNMIAVGDGKNNFQNFGASIIQKIEGTWTIPSLPEPFLPAHHLLGGGKFNDVHYLDDRTAFVVGNYYTYDSLASFAVTDYTMIYYFDGSSWSQQPSPDFILVPFFSINGFVKEDVWSGSTPSLVHRTASGWASEASIFDSIGGIIRYIEKTPTGFIAGGIDALGNSLIMVRDGAPTPPSCSTATPPSGLFTTLTPTRIELHWTPMAGSVACQVKANELTPPNRSGTSNVTGLESSLEEVPLALLGAGSTWQWRVRCACSTSPIAASGFSAYDVFTIPALKETGPETASETAMLAWPNPANGMAYVKIPDHMEHQGILTLYGMDSRKVVEQSVITGQTVAVDLSSLTYGIYTVSIQSGGQLETLQLEVFNP